MLIIGNRSEPNVDQEGREGQSDADSYHILTFPDRREIAIHQMENHLNFQAMNSILSAC